MPSSNLYLWGEVLAMVDQVPHRRVLDVGPGWGKAATLLREYLNEPPVIIDAIEAWGPYVDEHRLRPLYDVVVVGDVREARDELLADYDVVLMVEVIEHMPLADGEALIDRIPGRVVLSTPVAWIDNPSYPPTERHLSLWELEHWEAIGRRRPLEVCYQSLGGWLVRFGPRP